MDFSFCVGKAAAHVERVQALLIPTETNQAEVNKEIAASLDEIMMAFKMLQIESSSCSCGCGGEK